MFDVRLDRPAVPMVANAKRGRTGVVVAGGDFTVPASCLEPDGSTKSAVNCWHDLVDAVPDWCADRNRDPMMSRLSWFTVGIRADSNGHHQRGLMGLSV
ncbi:MAG: hypothetical protein U0936_16790 [Planctomycetaceae bacterium]